MKINTGCGTISLTTLIGIWSISALTSLPGLAISPILGKLSTIFPNATELDIQMLSSLPSFLIIPFVILSGKLTDKINNIHLLRIGLIIFGISGVLYLFLTEMWQLIVVSCLLGVGAGIIIPLSTGLISQFFTGKYRIKQFGLSSSISNVTLVIATSVTGYLAEVNWHLPFLVYLLPFVSIIFSLYLKENSKPNNVLKEKDADLLPNVLNSKYGIDIKHLIQVMGFYGLVTFLNLVVIFTLPFIMKEYGLTSGDSGIMISLFFLAVMLPGLFLNQIISRFKEKTKFYCLLLMALGMGLIVITRSEFAIGVGCFLIGFGYGVIQPAVYEFTTRTAIPKKATLALALTMAMNYLAILLYPFVMNLIESVSHDQSQQLPFIINMAITLFVAILAYVKRDSALFRSTDN